jgi:hypothetical protein
MQGGDLGVLAELEEAEAGKAKEPQNEREDSKSTISSESQKGERKSVAQIFSERIDKWKLKTQADLIVRDQLEFDDPHAVADCAQAIYESLREAEQEFMVDPGYLQKI